MISYIRSTFTTDKAGPTQGKEENVFDMNANLLRESQRFGLKLGLIGIAAACLAVRLLPAVLPAVNLSETVNTVINTAGLVDLGALLLVVANERLQVGRVIKNLTAISQNNS
ncbi:MAG TPA: hypothetical protein VJC17_01910 [Candidatus Dojkabacteria bacterium]|nr:hypothetical protein [Candidatus Dojkabacteria bacterium]